MPSTAVPRDYPNVILIYTGYSSIYSLLSSDENLPQRRSCHTEVAKITTLWYFGGF